MTATAEAKAASSIGPFTVEIGAENNGTVLINTLRMKVRGRWDRRNFYDRTDADGKPLGSVALGEIMSSMPDIPGIHVSIYYGKGKVELFDPLESDQELLDRINRVESQRGSQRWGPVKRKEYTLDEDQLKTLVLELIYKCENGYGQLVRGQLPSPEQLEKAPGRELYDTMSNSQFQPRYKDQVTDWQKKMRAAQMGLGVE